LVLVLDIKKHFERYNFMLVICI